MLGMSNILLNKADIVTNMDPFSYKNTEWLRNKNKIDVRVGTTENISLKLYHKIVTWPN